MRRALHIIFFLVIAGFLFSLIPSVRNFSFRIFKSSYITCGNGELDSGEACDGSAGIHVPHTICSGECKVITQSYCGDGIMQKPNEEKKGGPNNDGMEACDKDSGIDARYANSYKFDEKCSDQCAVVNVPPTSGLEIKGFPIASELSGKYVATLKAVNSDRTKKLVVMLKGYNINPIQNIRFTRPEENCQVEAALGSSDIAVLSSDKGACYAKIPLAFSKPGTALLKVLQFYPDQENASDVKDLFIEVQPPPPQITPTIVAGYDYSAVSTYVLFDEPETQRNVYCQTPYGLMVSTNDLKTQINFEEPSSAIKNLESLGNLNRFVIPNPNPGNPSEVALKFNCTLKFTDEYLIIAPSERDPDAFIRAERNFRFVASGAEPTNPPRVSSKDVELEVSAHDSSYAVTITKQYGSGDLKPIGYDAYATFSDPEVTDLVINFSFPPRVGDYFQLEPCKVTTGNLYDPQSEGKRPWEIKDGLEAQYSMDGSRCQVHLNPKLIIANRHLKAGDRFDLEQPFEMSLSHETIASEKRSYSFKIHAIYEALKNPLLTHAAPPATPPPIPPVETPPAVPPKGGWNWSN